MTHLSDHTDTCLTCGKLVGKTKSGNVRSHRKNGQKCPGSGQPRPIPRWVRIHVSHRRSKV